MKNGIGIILYVYNVCLLYTSHAKNSKQKFIIIGVIIAIIVIVAGYFMVRQVRMNEAQKRVEEA